jgi:hypothetical protein
MNPYLTTTSAIKHWSLHISITSLYAKYYSGVQIKKNEMGWACSMYGGEERCIQDFGGRPEWGRPCGRPRHRWEDIIKMDLQEVGWGGHGLGWSGSGQGQVVSSCECGNEPSGSTEYGEFLD